LLPARLLAGRADRHLRRTSGMYFLLVGLGFLLVEIAAMQRLVLLLGDPAHAFALTLATFLVCAGIGSGMAAWAVAPGSHTWARWFGQLELVLPLIIGLAALHGLASPWLMAYALELAQLPRAVLALALVAPLAFAMGLPFPLALARVRSMAPALVPWAWGVNGCASVIAATLAGLLLMSIGNSSLTLLGALAYALAAWVQRGIRPGEPEMGLGEK
jgi:hypothetical protein